MSLTTKRRSSDVVIGRAWWWSEAEQSALQPPKVRPPSQADGSIRVVAPTAWKETQVTESENHPTWGRHKTFAGDIGGDFYSQRKSCSFKNPSVLTWERYQPSPQWFPDQWVRQYRYGPILAFNPFELANPYPSSQESGDTTLDAWGAKAIAACKPTNAVADCSTMLGEVLREGLPKLIGASLWKDKTREARKRASDEFLNYQFGWAPLAREIGSVAHAIWNAQTALEQFQRDSGKMVRRRFEFPPEYSSTFDTPWVNVRGYMPGNTFGVLNDGAATARVLRKREVLRRRWFSGAFTYYLPSDGNVFESMAGAALKAKKTIGLSLTPDVVWNLAPWSWAVDWFTNAGDVVSNLTDWAIYGLCLRYGYIMEHTTVRDTYTYAGKSGYKRTPYIPSQMILETETKIRRKANPFGFGLTWNGLSPIQLAIAAALGISRS